MIKSSQVYDLTRCWTINKKCRLTLTQIRWPIYRFRWSLFVQIQIAEDQTTTEPATAATTTNNNLQTLVNDDAHALKTGTESQWNRKFFCFFDTLAKRNTYKMGQYDMCAYSKPSRAAKKGKTMIIIKIYAFFFCFHPQIFSLLHSMWLGFEGIVG